MIELSKVIINELLDNTFKFFEKEKLEINMKVNDNELYLSDNCIGIPPEEKNKVFEPFYQIEKNFTGQVILTIQN